MISHTKPLRIKELLSKKLKIGESRLRFTDKTWEILNKQEVTNVTNKLIREIIEASAYRVIPAKIREYKIYYGKVKRSDVKVRDKIKPTNKLSYLLKRKIITKKDIWIKKIREIRAYLKTKKEELGNKKYRELRANAKGNVYESVKDIERRL